MSYFSPALRAFCICLMLAISTSFVRGDEGAAPDVAKKEAAAAKNAAELAKIEASIEQKPEDPLLHYRKCQLLFAAGKEQEAFEHATVAMSKFKAAGQELAWMKLGSLSTGKYHVDVLFNMGESERAEKKDGIVRPLSFRVFSLAGAPELVHTLDFEHGYSDGKLFTAAIGETTENGHGNYGILDPDSKFAVIKKKVLEIVNDQKPDDR